MIGPKVGRSKRCDLVSSLVPKEVPVTISCVVHLLAFLTSAWPILAHVSALFQVSGSASNKGMDMSKMRLDSRLCHWGIDVKFLSKWQEEEIQFGQRLTFQHSHNETQFNLGMVSTQKLDFQWFRTVFSTPFPIYYLEEVLTRLGGNFYGSSPSSKAPLPLVEILLLCPTQGWRKGLVVFAHRSSQCHNHALLYSSLRWRFPLVAPLCCVSHLGLKQCWLLQLATQLLFHSARFKGQNLSTQHASFDQHASRGKSQLVPGGLKSENSQLFMASQKRKLASILCCHLKRARTEFCQRVQFQVRARDSETAVVQSEVTYHPTTKRTTRTKEVGSKRQHIFSISFWSASELHRYQIDWSVWYHWHSCEFQGNSSVHPPTGLV